MLINFRVQNYRSIHDEQSLSILRAPAQANQDQEGSPKSEETPPEGEQDADEGTPPPPLPRAFEITAIFGANASGKTNLTEAMSVIPLAVRAARRAITPHPPTDRDEIPDRIEDIACDPFLATGSSSYEIDAILGDHVLRYGFAVSRRANGNPKIEEWLMVEAGDGFVPLMSRVDRRVDLHPETARAIGAADPTPEQRTAIEACAQDPVLVLPTAARVEIPTSRALCAYLASWDLLSDPTRREIDRDDRIRRAARDPRALAELREVLAMSDVGIDDLRVDADIASRPDPGSHILHLHHRHGKSTLRWSPIYEQSAGTLALIDLTLAAHAALSHRSLLLVDDFDASLHPLLAARLLSRFQHAARRDGGGAQIVLTTHNVHLLDTRLIDDATMGNPALCPEQIWIVEKRSDGSTRLGSLGEFKLPPSTSASLSRGYLQGRFGGIPILHHRLAKP